MNVIFFLVFVLSIFAIFGVHQFMGAQYKRCRMTEAPVLEEYSTEAEYAPWEINGSVSRLCLNDDSCCGYDSDAAVHKCGSYVEFY